MLTTAPAPSAASSRPGLPLHLSVTARDTSGTTTTAGGPSRPLAPHDADAHALRDAQRLKRARVAASEARVDRLMMRDRSGVREIKKATAFLQPHHWQAIAHERHLNSHCSYPACDRPPLRRFSSSPRYQLVALPSARSTAGSRRRHDFVKTTGNPQDGFCSRACTARGTWVARRLRTEPVWVRELEDAGKRREWEVEDMLEELEADGRFRLEGVDEGAGGERKIGEQSEPKSHAAAAQASPRREGNQPTTAGGHEVAAYEVDLPPTVEVAPPMASIQPLLPHEEGMGGRKAIATAVGGAPAGTTSPSTELAGKASPGDSRSASALAVSSSESEVATPRAGKAVSNKSPGSKAISDLLDTLRIVEHPITIGPIPAPPSLGPAAKEGLSDLAPTSRSVDRPSGSKNPSNAPPKSATGKSPSHASPSAKAKETARRRFMSSAGGPYLSSDTAGLLASQVVTASREAAELRPSPALGSAGEVADEEAPDSDSEVDEAQALEDLIFEQMMDARREVGEELR